MKQLKTLHFPNEAEPREIVDAYARERIENLTASSDAPVLDATLDANGIMTYNNSPAFDEWLTEVEGSERFAPSGYGYGGAPIYLGKQYSEPELDAALTNVYSQLADCETKLIYWEGAGSWRWFAQMARSSANYGTVLAHCAENGGSIILKTLSSGTWQPLEWENPPMVPGVEYRTTERWNGHPVYTAAVNMGTSASGLFGVDTDFTCTNVIRWAGMNGGNALPFINQTLDNQYSVWATAYNNSGHVKVMLMCNSGASGASAIVQVWYVKK